jgi:hypothetical protein
MHTDASCMCVCVSLHARSTRQADWTYFGHQFEPAFSRWPLAVASGCVWRGAAAAAAGQQ